MLDSLSIMTAFIGLLIVAVVVIVVTIIVLKLLERNDTLPPTVRETRDTFVVAPPLTILGILFLVIPFLGMQPF